MELSKALVQSLIESSSLFPVNLDDAWVWLGYSSKASAKKKLINNFEEGSDFSAKWIKTPGAGRSSEQIMLTVACFKDLGMMAGTDQGKKVRQYFRECEEHFQKARIVISEQNEEIARLQLEVELARLRKDAETTFFAVVSTMGESAGRRLMAEARGESPIQVAEPEPEIIFVEQGTDNVVGRTASGRTITALLKDTGYNPKSKKDMEKAKERLKAIGVDYETGAGLEEAAYIRHHFVIAAEKYDEARRILTQDNAAANLFVWGMQQKAIAGKNRFQIKASEQ